MPQTSQQPTKITSISLEEYNSSASPSGSNAPLGSAEPLFSARYHSHSEELPQGSRSYSDSLYDGPEAFASADGSHLLEKNGTSFLLQRPDQLTTLKTIKRKSRKIRWTIGIISFLASIFLIYWVWSSFSASTRSFLAFAPKKPNLFDNSDSHGFFKLDELPEVLTTSGNICSFCDCQLNRTSPPLLSSSLKQSSSETRSSLLAHVWLSIRDIYCQHAWLGEGPALDLLLATDLSQDLSTHIQWRLNSLKSGVPTAYIFTKTSWAGRTKHLRYAYFKRHILTIRTHLDQIRRSKWPQEGSQARWGNNRQLVWLIVEDGEKLANDVAQELANTDIPYIYFTYGPTHHFGNAQQNAAYALIHRLSDPSQGGFLGHGPIISIDDDSNFLPQLLVIIWGVKRIGVWPMGNLGPHGWEGPFYDENHKLVKWEAGAVNDRKFPIDNGAFAFSSELLGTVIKGPRYWPTDISGGENEFIRLIVQNKEEIEPLCYNCHVAWHNEPLPPACTDLQRCP